MLDMIPAARTNPRYENTDWWEQCRPRPPSLALGLKNFAGRPLDSVYTNSNVSDISNALNTSDNHIFDIQYITIALFIQLIIHTIP